MAAGISGIVVEAAFALIFCEYIAGILLVSTVQMKSIGSEMVDNAMGSAALVAAMMFAGVIMDTLLRFLYPGGGSYVAFQAWADMVYGQITELVGAMAIFIWLLETPGNLFSTAAGSLLPGAAPGLPIAIYVNTLMGPWIQTMQGSLLIFAVLGQLATIFDKGWLVFVAYGSLIYAAPWRIGRNLGASLISGGIVFHIGLPVMPAFINYFAKNVFTEIPSFCSVVMSTANIPDCGAGSVASLITVKSLISVFFAVIRDVVSPITWLYMILPVLYLTLLLAGAAGFSQLLGGMHSKLMPLLRGGV